MAAAAWLVTALLGFEAICCCGSDHENGGFGVYRSRKVFLRGVSSSSMNLGVSGVDLPSSVVFPVCGNVYPLGFYYVLVNVGQPPKPYFLDPDTGSDLTWLQCDAPCVRSTKAPHPLYRPGNDLVVTHKNFRVPERIARSPLVIYPQKQDEALMKNSGFLWSLIENSCKL